MKNSKGHKIVARRDYRDAVSGELVHVYGWESVTLGIEGSAKWPQHTERWCRINGAMGGRMLCSPNRLVAQ